MDYAESHPALSNPSVRLSDHISGFLGPPDEDRNVTGHHLGSGRRVDFLDKREKVARWSDRIVSSMIFPTFKNILSRSWQELPGQEI